MHNLTNNVQGSFLEEGVSSVSHEESSLATSKGPQFALGASLWKFIGTINYWNWIMEVSIILVVLIKSKSLPPA